MFTPGTKMFTSQHATFCAARCQNLPVPSGRLGSARRRESPSIVGSFERSLALTELKPKRRRIQLLLPACPTPLPAARLTATHHHHALSLRSLALQIPPLPHRLPHRPRHATASSASSVAMTPAKIAIIFFAISSLLLLSHARFVPDDFFPSTTAVSEPHQPEDPERTAAVVPPEKTTEGSISAAVEPFHQVDLSLRRPIGRHIHRPIDPNFLRPFRHGCHGHRHGHLGRREIPYGDDMIRFPRGPKFQRGFPGEMRQIPMRWPRMPKEFLGEMPQIPSRTPEFERGLWKERPAMVHGMREAEGREVSIEEKAREKLVEGEDGDLVKRFWAIVNRF